MALAAFGFFMALHYSAPWYAWVIGFCCLLLDQD